MLPSRGLMVEVHQGWLVVAASNEVLAWTGLAPVEDVVAVFRKSE